MTSSPQHGQESILFGGDGGREGGGHIDIMVKIIGNADNNGNVGKIGIVDNVGIVGTFS